MIELVGEGNITNEVLPSDVYYGRELPIAIFVFIFSASFAALYIVVMLAIRSERDYKTLTAYRIMVHIGVADTIQLGIHFIAGIYILIQTEQYGLLEQIIGGCLNAAWCTMLFFSILLTANRLVIIVFHFSSKAMFSDKMTNVYIGIGWLFCLAIVGINLSPLSKFYYVVPLYTWHYEEGFPLSYILRVVSARLAVAEVIFAVFAYAIIFSYIRIKAAILSKKEMYLTIQVLTIGAFHIFGFFFWEYWPLPEHPLFTFFGHFIWMLWNALNPVIHLIVSPRIRGNALAIFGVKRNSTDVSVLSMVHKRGSNVTVTL